MATRWRCPPESRSGRTACLLVEADAGEQLRGARAGGVVARDALEHHRVFDVLRRGEHGDEIEGLEDEAEPVAPEIGAGVFVHRRHGHAVEGRGFPRPGRSRSPRRLISVVFPEPEGP